MKKIKSLFFVLIATILILIQTKSRAPFLDFNEIHPTRSEFEFNLILNQNRNTPIVLLQFSQNKTEKIMRNIVETAFRAQPDIAFAMFVDCRDFSFDLNRSLSLCRGFEEYQKTYVPRNYEEDDPEKIDDPFFGFDFFSPNPTRIREKGHVIAKNHDSQNLRALNVGVNGDYLAKIIRNQIPDFVTYIEDQRDLEDFLQIQSDFSLSKGPKLLYFDQNLQSPLFLKKLAVALDGWFKIAVSDSPKMAAQFKSDFEKLVLLEYNFKDLKYDAKILNSENELESVLENKVIKSYTQIRKPRDILLDFEHREALIYNITNLKQVENILSHGRMIVLQISEESNSFVCPSLSQIQLEYQVLFNYACFKTEKVTEFLTMIQIDPQLNWNNKIFFIDRTLSKVKILEKSVNLYKQLPQAQARQKVTTEKESQMCIEGAKAAQKEPVLYFFNQKTHSTSLYLLRYFGSLNEVNSLLYFCQIILPDQDIRRTYQLTENAIFTLTPADQKGQSQKVEHTKTEDFFSIKMFLREIAVAKMMRIYEQRILYNKIVEIKSAQELTEKCFSHNCIIALIQTNTFHQQSEINILKEMQIAFSDLPFKYYWIDGLCHFEVGKQLKLTPKGSNNIERSYLFMYNEKTNRYALWKGNKYNQFWLKKDIFRWVKSLRNQSNIGKIKFGVDFQDRVCNRNQKSKQTKSKPKPQLKEGDKKNERNRDVSPDQL